MSAPSQRPAGGAGAGLGWAGQRHRVGCWLTAGFPCRRAKLLLKKKRYREQLLDKTENQITSLETMVGQGTRVGARRAAGSPRCGLKHIFLFLGLSARGLEWVRPRG